VKCNERRGGLERFRINVMNDGYDCVGITCAFELKTLRTQVKRYACFRGASGKLSIEHLVNLPQARIGSMAVLLAPCGRQQGENAKYEEAGEGWKEMPGKDACVFHQGASSVHNLEAVFFDDRVCEHFF
jgi:hypothetical protein